LTTTTAADGLTAWDAAADEAPPGVGKMPLAEGTLTLLARLSDKKWWK
jgi:hypothetical protein